MHKYRLDPAAVGLFGGAQLFGSSVGRWYIERQAINVFVTNMVGPSGPLRMLGAEVLDIVPVAISGTSPSPSACSPTRGTLTVSVNADPKLPDLGAFVAGLRHAMREQSRAAGRRRCWLGRRLDPLLAIST